VSDRHKPACPNSSRPPRSFRAALTEDVIERGEFARHVRNAVARVYIAAALLGAPQAIEAEDDPPEQRPRGESAGDALWKVRWAFESHCGQHAVAVLRPLHQRATYGGV